METKYSISKPSVQIMLFYCLLAGILALLGFVYYGQNKEQAKDRAFSELETITALKGEQVALWRSERLNDAEYFYANESFRQAVVDLSENPSSELFKENIRQRVHKTKKENNYSHISFYDTTGAVFFGIGDDLDTSARISTGNVIAAMQEKNIVFGDFERHSVTGKIAIDIYIPILSSNEVCKAVMVLCIDPYLIFYPMLTYFPVELNTSEVMLLRKEGDSLVYLSELKYLAAEPLTQYRSIDEQDLSSAVAIRQNGGRVEGKDYRGVDVLAFAAAVPGTDWLFVIEVDCEEIYGPLFERAAFSIIFLTVFLFCVIWFLRLYYQRREKELLKEHIEEKSINNALVHHYQNINKYSNDIILLLGQDDHILEVNDAAVKKYGYTREEFLAMNGAALRVPESLLTAGADVPSGGSEEGYMFETFHIRKDGTRFPVEVSSRFIKTEQGFFTQNFITDISERKNAERAVRESESRYRDYFDSVNDPIFMVETETGIIFDVNAAVLREYEFERDELIGSHITIVSKEPEKTEIAVRNASGFVPIRYHMKKDGTVLPVELNVNWLMHGEKKYTIGVARNISQRVKDEHKILKLNRSLKLFSLINLAIARSENQDLLLSEICRIIQESGGLRLVWIGKYNSHDFSIRPVYFSGYDEGFLECFSITALEEPAGAVPCGTSIRTKKESVCNNIAEDPMYALYRAAALQRGFRSAGSFPLTINGILFGNLNAFSTEQDHFDVQETEMFKEISDNISYALNMLEQKHLRFEAEKQVRKLSRAVEQSSSSVIITNASGVIEYVNPRCLSISGYAEDEVIGRNPRIFASGMVPSQVYEELWKTIRSGELWQGELINKKKDGEIFYESAAIAPIRNDDGEITHFIGIKEDLTRYKNIEKDLIEAKVKAENSDKLKSILLANLSHEFRTPMNGILGYSAILSDELDDPVQVEMLTGIIDAANRLLSTLNSILFIAQLAAEKIKPNPHPLLLAELIDILYTRYFEKAREKNLDLRIVMIDRYAEALADEELLITGVSNILENAVKFTSAGEVTIFCKVVEADSGRFVQIQIRDTGSGISEKDLEQIFEPFRQVSEGDAREFDGVGLGLPIAKQLIALMNGNLSVLSKIGEGSTFTITMPAAEDKKAKQIPQLPSEKNIPLKENLFALPHVLLVEDNITNIHLTKKFLESVCTIDAVETGKDAVRLAAEIQYDAVLMDINLQKGMNGLEATELIKKIQGYENIPIIAVTGYAMAFERTRFLNSGMSHYLAKPFTKKDICSLLLEAINQSKKESL